MEQYTAKELMDFCDEAQFLRSMPTDIDTVCQYIEFFGPIMVEAYPGTPLFEAATLIMQHLHYRYVLFDDQAPTPRDVAFKAYYEAKFPKFSFLHSDVLSHHAPYEVYEENPVEQCEELAPVDRLEHGVSAIVIDPAHEAYDITIPIQRPSIIADTAICDPYRRPNYWSDREGWMMSLPAVTFDLSTPKEVFDACYAELGLSGNYSISRHAPLRLKMARFESGYSIGGVLIQRCSSSIFKFSRRCSDIQSHALFIILVQALTSIGSVACYTGGHSVYIRLEKYVKVRRLTELAGEAMVKSCLRSII